MCVCSRIRCVCALGLDGVQCVRVLGVYGAQQWAHHPESWKMEKARFPRGLTNEDECRVLVGGVGEMIEDGHRLPCQPTQFAHTAMCIVLYCNT